MNTMDLLNQISNKISALHSGEKCTISVQDLQISRNDFQSMSVFLSRESEKGLFSIDLSQPVKTWFEQTSVTIIKK